MGDELFAINFQELIQMGFSDEIALEALGNSSDLQSAIDFIYSKSSQLGDVKQILYNYDEPLKKTFPPAPVQPLLKPSQANHSLNSFSNQSLPQPSYSNTISQPRLNSASMTGSQMMSNPFASASHQSSQAYQSSFNNPGNFGMNPNNFPVYNNHQNVPNFSGPAPGPYFVPPSMPAPLPGQYGNHPPTYNSVDSVNQATSAKFYSPDLKNQFIPNLPKPQVSPNLVKIPPRPFVPPAPVFCPGPLVCPGPSVYSPQSFPLKPLEDEDFHEFLYNCLQLRGTNDIDAIEICSNCVSKEEALLILGIPMTYKDTPLSQIPNNLIAGEQFNEVALIDDVKKELIKSGASPQEAHHLASTYQNLPEALQAFFNQAEEKYSSPYKPLPPPISAKYHKKSVISPPKLPKFPVNLSSSSSSYSSNEDLFSSYPSRLSKSSKPVVLNAPSESDPVAPDAKTSYFETLQNYRLVMSESPEIFQDFNLGVVASSGPAFTKRINAEMKTIKTTVPCDSTASIFTLIDSECMHRIKFLLSGTIDTPYAHGLYLFDVLLPNNYPNSPPKVNIRTTGNGKMRFNPNLYSNGYVCLSIINTWSGRPEEQWNPSSSTMLQVMLSIQSLVMDSNVIQKEPGFANLPTNSNENLGYQIEVKYGNLKYAMIENIKNPPAGFRDVIFNHFKCKKQEILNTAKKWTEEIKNMRSITGSSQNPGIDAEINQKTPHKAFLEAYNELNSLLSNL